MPKIQADILKITFITYFIYPQTVILWKVKIQLEVRVESQKELRLVIPPRQRIIPLLTKDPLDTLG